MRHEEERRRQEEERRRQEEDSRRQEEERRHQHNVRAAAIARAAAIKRSNEAAKMRAKKNHQTRFGLF